MPLTKYRTYRYAMIILLLLFIFLFFFIFYCYYLSLWSPTLTPKMQIIFSDLTRGSTDIAVQSSICEQKYFYR